MNYEDIAATPTEALETRLDLLKSWPAARFRASDIVPILAEVIRLRKANQSPAQIEDESKAMDCILGQTTDEDLTDRQREIVESVGAAVAHQQALTKQTEDANNPPQDTAP